MIKKGGGISIFVKYYVHCVPTKSAYSYDEFLQTHTTCSIHFQDMNPPPHHGNGGYISNCIQNAARVDL